MNQCKSTKTNGDPCEATPGESGYCVFHDPDYKEQAHEIRSKGGRARAYPKLENTPIDLADPKGYTILLGEIIEMLRGLDCSVPQARALLTAIDAGIKVQEFTSISDRLTALEAKAKENK